MLNRHSAENSDENTNEGDDSDHHLMLTGGELERRNSRIELSENEQANLLRLLGDAQVTPYEDSFAFKENNQNQSSAIIDAQDVVQMMPISGGGDISGGELVEPPSLPDALFFDPMNLKQLELNISQQQAAAEFTPK